MMEFPDIKLEPGFIEAHLDKIAANMLIDPKILVRPDEICLTLGVQLQAFLAVTQQLEQTIPIVLPRATFLDWLLRRERTTWIKCTIKDVLLDPPKDMAKWRETIRMYRYLQDKS